MHIIMEVITSRYRIWRRHQNQLQSASNNVAYSRGSKRHGREDQSDKDDGDDSDSLETSRLITLADDTEHQNLHAYTQCELDRRGSLNKAHLPLADISSEQTGCPTTSIDRACTSTAKDHLPTFPSDRDLEGMRVASPSGSHSTMDDGVFVEEGSNLLLGEGFGESVALLVPERIDTSEPMLMNRESDTFSVPTDGARNQGQSVTEQNNALSLLLPHSGNRDGPALQHKPKKDGCVDIVQTPMNTGDNFLSSAGGSREGDGMCSENTDCSVGIQLSRQRNNQFDTFTSAAENGSCKGASSGAGCAVGGELSTNTRNSEALDWTS